MPDYNKYDVIEWSYIYKTNKKCSWKFLSKMIDFEVRGRAVQTIKRSLDVRLRLFKAVNGFLAVSSRCLKGRLSFFVRPFQFNYLIPQFFWKQKTIQTLFGFYELEECCVCVLLFVPLLAPPVQNCLKQFFYAKTNLFSHLSEWCFPPFCRYCIDLFVQKISLMFLTVMSLLVILMHFEESQHFWKEFCLQQFLVWSPNYRIIKA